MTPESPPEPTPKIKITAKNIRDLIVVALIVISMVGAYLYPQVKQPEIGPILTALPTLIPDQGTGPQPLGLMSSGTNLTDLALSGTLDVTGKTTITGPMVLASAAITPATGSTLTAAYTYYIVHTSGAITMTLGTTNAVAGQLLIIYGDDANNIVINDTNLLSSTGGTITVNQYDAAVFIYDALHTTDVCIKI
jgi:hypothetical protein